ncbi:hypothetical protein ACGFK1_08340 [Mycobacterium sp. NPDC048908]|uniref:hypothetical protein n=1 Tax=Mycobacterium sp. NPDC048908 TaxID=3364292 RepID=UPI00372394CB
MTELITEYCRVCGHAKQHHDLHVHLDPADHGKAREEAAKGHGPCHDMSYGDNACICVEYRGWT